MANPSKAKGTNFENEVVARLREVWEFTERASTNKASHDVSVPPGFPVECKHRKTWAVPAWVRAIRKAALGQGGLNAHRWLIFVADGDRRRADSPGEVVVLDPDFVVELLAAWQAQAEAPRLRRRESDVERDLRALRGEIVEIADLDDIVDAQSPESSRHGRLQLLADDLRGLK